MSDNLTSLLIVAVCTLGPLALIFAYLARTRAIRALNRQDAAALDGMLDTQARLEARVQVLERVLDAELPDWRSNSESYRRAS